MTFLLCVLCVLCAPALSESRKNGITNLFDGFRAVDAVVLRRALVAGLRPLAVVLHQRLGLAVIDVEAGSPRLLPLLCPAPPRASHPLLPSPCASPRRRAACRPSRPRATCHRWRSAECDNAA